MAKLAKLIGTGCIATISWSAQSAPIEGGKRVLLHSYGSQNLQDEANELYLQDTAPGLEAKVNRLFNNMDSRIDINESSPSKLSLTKNKFRSSEYQFAIDGFPLCQFQIKAHESNHGSVTVIGSMPDIKVDRKYSIRDWPIADDAFQLLQDTRFDHGIINSFSLLSKKSCLWIENNQLIPVWQLKLKAGKLIYNAIADANDVFDFQNGFFDVDGVSRIYSKNPLDGELEDFTVKNLKPDSDGVVLVENDKFITLFQEEDAYTYYQATAQSNAAAPYLFAPATTDDAFAEVSLFTNANRALDWFEERGYQNFGEKPIRIVVHAEFSGGDVNNALYQPADSYPTIFVGNGDGDTLQNLALDYDVVAHEFGHHVIYHTIKTIQQESLVIHEGLADFFTFAKTGDACLGESICPSTSGICAVANQCLRTADNDYTYDDPDLPTEAHLQSQFISGFLWDLNVVDGIPINKLSSMVLGAIDLFVSNSGFTHLVLALLMVDEVEYQGANCQVIYDRAVARGLGSKIASFDCTQIAALIESYGGSLKGIDKSDTSTTTRESTKSSKNWCGAIGFSGNEGGSILILLFLPLVIGMRRWF